MREMQKRAMRGYFRANYALYLMLTPALVYYLVFHYIPMLGVVVAFQKYNVFRGIFGSAFVGLDNFRFLVQFPTFSNVVRNTLLLNVLNLVVGFPAPILLALALHEIRRRGVKRLAQSVIYLPYFLSWVVLSGILYNMLSPQNGIVNHAIAAMGGQRIYFMANEGWWVTSYVFSSVWQSAGWGTIIYLAALTGVDPTLYEAAVIDGAGKCRQVWSITLPSILPTVVTMLILRVGSIVSIGFEQPMALYNHLVSNVAEVISTFVYRLGFEQLRYDISTAMGLIQSALNLVLIVTANYLSRRLTDSSIF